DFSLGRDRELQVWSSIPGFQSRVGSRVPSSTLDLRRGFNWRIACQMSGIWVQFTCVQALGVLKVSPTFRSVPGLRPGKCLRIAEVPDLRSGSLRQRVWFLKSESGPNLSPRFIHRILVCSGPCYADPESRSQITIQWSRSSSVT
uniref:Uncharacterized protein n=1 Tax=Cannabis sativa TaxID=3483 RepID=A0A803QRZ2_CANSA